MPDTVVLLGWGSLLWDPRREFDEQHGAWNNEGPTVPLEFSRISTTRGGALTLVIDAEHGQACRVAYAISKRSDFRDAVCDLRSREGTILDRIGCLRIGDAIPANEPVRSALSEWAAAAGIHVVVWTALATNFAQKKGVPFTLDAAITHLRDLAHEGKALAAEYVCRAPSFVDTPLRRALQAEPWFPTAA